MSAIKLLQEHRGGATHEEISDAIRDLVAAVNDEQKGGRITINLTIKPRGKGDGLDVRVEVKSFPPKQTPGTSVFFCDKENNLQRQDPRQTALELREITAPVHKALA